MTARTGMANLILILRAWTKVGNTDYTVAGISYWTDDQLQEVLDRYRTDFTYLPLTILQESNDNNVVLYKNYYFPQGFYEEATGGSAVWTVENSAGSNISTANYTVNYNAGHIAFTSDQGGTSYYLSARRYDMHRAAADVWRQKAADVMEVVDWSSDNHRVAASQKSKNYMTMAAQYESQAPAVNVHLRRGDLNV